MSRELISGYTIRTWWGGREIENVFEDNDDSDNR
jgi:hypothetical protein